MQLLKPTLSRFVASVCNSYLPRFLHLSLLLVVRGFYAVTNIYLIGALFIQHRRQFRSLSISRRTILRNSSAVYRFQVPVQSIIIIAGEGQCKMPPQSAEEEDRDFENVLRDRMPGVLQSSQRLQGVLGINRGTKMMDEMVMIPWILPEPPSLAKRERKGMQSKPTAGLPASTTGVDADVGHVSDEAVHGLEAPQLKKPSDVFCEAPPQIVLQPPPEESTQDQHVPMAAAPSQRKRHDFEPPTPGPLQSTTSAEPQSLLSDVPDSSSVDRPQPKTALRQSSLQSAFEPKQAVDAEHKSAPFTISDHPDAIGWEVASPPPLHKIPDRPLGPKIKHPL